MPLGAGAGGASAPLIGPQVSAVARVERNARRQHTEQPSDTAILPPHFP
jgi:hypothetical protein